MASGGYSDSLYGEVMPYDLRPIGRVESPLRDVVDAPLQGDEGAPESRLILDHEVAEGLAGLKPGSDMFILTWLERARRDVLRVHPRGNRAIPQQGVFSTRSPSRPNPI